MDGNLAMTSSLEVERPDLELKWHIEEIEKKIKNLEIAFTIFTVNKVMKELIDLNSTVFYEDYTTDEDRYKIKEMIKKVARKYELF